MNKIYRVIYNKSTQTFQAVNEFAKSQGKSASATVGSVGEAVSVPESVRHIAKLTAVALGMMTVINPAMAATAQNNLVVDVTGAVAAGSDAVAGGDASVAIGKGAKTDTSGAIAIGERATVTVSGTTLADGSPAIGGIAIGTGTRSNHKDTIAMGTGASATDVNAAAIGTGASASVEDATAIGAGSLASGPRSIALSKEAKATGGESIALGYQAEAKSFGTALGSKSKTEDNYALAVGYEAQAIGQQSTAVGYKAEVTKESISGIAVGQEASAQEDHAMAMGFQAVASGERATAIGDGARASAVDAIAQGTGAYAIERSAIATGTSALALAENTMAQGTGAKAFKLDAMAQGTNAKAVADSAVAIGKDAYVGSVEITPEKLDELAKAYAEGESEKVTLNSRLNEIFAETDILSAEDKKWRDLRPSTDEQRAERAEKRAEIAKKMEALDAEIVELNDKLDAAEKKANDAKAELDAIQVAGIKGIAIGDATKVYADGGVAQGVGASVAKDSVNAIAMGTDAKVAANSTNSMALGTGASVAENLNNAVALGANSVVTAVAKVPDAEVNGITYGDFAGNRNDMGKGDVVSVGSAGKERRIQNVAAGLISKTSTDAINGSQLYMVADKLAGGWVIANAAGKVGDVKIGQGNQVKFVGEGNTAVTVEGTNGQYTVKISSTGTTGTGTGTAPNNYFHVNPNENPVAATGTNNEAAVDGIGNATGGKALAAGFNATASGKTSVAIGEKASADNLGGIAIGQNALSSTLDKNADANKAQQIDGVNKAIAIGNSAQATNGKTVAIGDAAAASGLNAVAIGSQTKSTGTESTVVGSATEAHAAYSVAIGQRANVTSTGFAATAIGNLALASGGEATALGRSAKAEGSQATAIGSNATASGQSGVAMGTLANASAVHSVAISTEALATANQAIAIGRNAKSLGGSSVAIGDSAEVAEGKTNSVAIGWDATVTGSSAVALGRQANATFDNAVSIGSQANALSTSATAIGQRANATHGNAIAMGTDSKALNANTVAIGRDANASLIDSVALGYGATTTAATQTTGANINGISYGLVNGAGTSFAGANANTNYVVSVGKAGAERQIQNVAAGRISNGSTDAINGSQLYAVMTTGSWQLQHAGAKVGDVNWGDKVNFISDDNSVTITPTNEANGVSTLNFKVNTDGTTIKVNNDGKIAANTGDLTNNADTGAVNTPSEEDGKKLTTVADVAEAINNSGFRVKSAGTNKATGDDATERLVKTGELVEFEAGDNLTVKRVGGRFTFATKDDVQFNSVQFGGDTGPKITHDGNNIKVGDKDGNATSITNVKSNLAPVTVADGEQPSANNPDNLADKLNNAATVADVLNAGWNLQDNGTSIDTVTHNDAVNFVNGRGTSVSVTPNEDGTVNNIQVDSALGYVNKDDATDTSTPSDTVKLYGKGDEPVQLTNLASGLRKEDGTAPTGQELIDAIANAAGDVLNNAVNVGDLKAATNAAKTEVVSYDESIKVTESVGDNGQTIYDLAVSVDDTTIETDGNGRLRVKTTTLTPETNAENQPTGKIAAPNAEDAEKLVNAGDIANAINKSGFNLKTSATAEGSKENGTANDGELINPSDTVEMVAGKNLTVKQDADGKVTFATKDDVQFNSVQFGDNTGPKITNDGNNIKVGDKDGNATSITNVKSNLAPVTVADGEQPSANNPDNLADKLNNAATVADVLNAGWNLQDNGTSVDTVTHNDAVNFVNGRGTSVSVKPNEDGTVNNIQVDSALGYVNKDDATDTSTPSDTVKLYGKGDEPVQLTNLASGLRKEDGTAPTGQELIDAIANAAGDVLNNAVNVGDLKAATNAAKTEVVSYDESIKVTESVGDNGQTIYDLAVSVDDTTIETDGNGRLRVKTTTLTPETNAENQPTGKIAAPNAEDAEKLVNAGDIANAINKSGFNLKTSATAEGSKENGTANDGELINPSDTVEMVAGKNLTVKQDADGKVTFATKDDVQFNSVQFGDNTGPKITNDGNNIKVGDKDGNATSITNVKSNLAPVTVADGEQPSANNPDNLADKLNNAATVADVLNAGWNLQDNGTSVDTVTHNDAVNFVNGRGTSVSVKPNEDGTVNNIQVDSALGYVNKDDATDTSTPSDTVKLYGKGDEPVQLTNLASGLRKEDGTAPTGQELIDAIANAAGDVLNNAVNVGDLKAATNAAKTEVVSYDESIKVTESVGDNGQTIYDLAVSVDDTTIETDGNGRLRVKTTTLTPETNAENQPTGKIAAPNAEDAEKLVNAGDIANAINKSGFNLKTSATAEGKKEAGTADNGELINPSDTVEMVAGKNLTVKQDADGKVTFATKDDVQFNSVQFGDNTGPKITNDGNNIKVGDKDGNATSITNVKSNLAPVTVADGEQPSANNPDNLADKLNNAATVADVLNAGWNLQDNGTSVDTVTHNDAVNFVNGRGTSVSVKPNEDGTVNNIQVDSALGYVNNDATDTSTPSDTVKLYGEGDEPVQLTNLASGVRKPDGSTLTGKELAEAIQNATGNTLTNAVNIGDLQAATAAAKTEVVSYDESIKVTESVGDNGQTIYDLAVSVDDTTIETDGNGRLRVKTTTLTPETNAENKPTGKIAAPNAEDAEKLVNAGDIANAINNSGWNLAAEGTNGEELINPSDKVTFKTGSNNLTVKRDGANITYDLARNIDVDTVTAGDTKVDNNGITINNGAAGNPVSLTKNGLNNGGNRITNVAAGRADTDAVNVSQLKGAVNYLDNKINRNNRDLRAGIAGSNAAAGLPQVYIPGKSMVAASAGTFKGEAALAVGYSRASDNGKLILKLQGNTNTRGDVGGSVGIGYQW